MARIKMTKSELKAQRRELQRYERFLPTLQLKKQQLQIEVQRVRARLEDVRQEERSLLDSLEQWISLFAEAVDIESLIKVGRAEIRKENVVGLTVKRFKDIRFEETSPDLLQTPPWVDDGLEAVKEAVRLRLQKEFLQEELSLMGAELRRTSQRVNLFEKVKIPECRENIRVIQIALGDLQTTAVVRAKLAKAKLSERSSGL
ncbi:MAG: V-type ATP synthase subunit D [Desulfohalobiaceae bacterium]|nr:V-type ATP synthase subunit D [Desulfohalobiaceae bacterium]